VRFEDLTDYLELRRIAESPFEIIRFRKKQSRLRDLEMRFRGRPPLH